MSNYTVQKRSIDRKTLCYNRYMKLLMIFSFFFISFQSQANCRYTIIKQDGKYLLVKQVIGDLPGKNAKITQKLQRGINELKYQVKIDEEETEAVEKKESRVQVRFETDNKEYAEQLLGRYCPN